MIACLFFTLPPYPPSVFVSMSASMTTAFTCPLPQLSAATAASGTRTRLPGSHILNASRLLDSQPIVKCCVIEPATAALMDQGHLLSILLNCLQPGLIPREFICVWLPKCSAAKLTAQPEDLAWLHLLLLTKTAVPVKAPHLVLKYSCIWVQLPCPSQVPL